MKTGSPGHTQRIDRSAQLLTGLVAWSLLGGLVLAVGVLVGPGLRVLASDAGAELWQALVVSARLVLGGALVAFPLGLGAAIWMEEYLGPGRGRDLVEANLCVLAGAPALLYGLVGLSLGLRAVSGALILAMFMVPSVILHAREAIARVPQIQREAGLALGATRGRVIWDVVLPASARDIGAGLLAAFARGLGSAAPLFVMGSLLASNAPARGLEAPDNAVLAVQIFAGLTEPFAGSGEISGANLAGGALVLTAACLVFDGLSRVLRGPRA